jgi:hypothetical protein
MAKVAQVLERDVAWFHQPGAAEGEAALSQLKQTLQLLLRQLEQTQKQAASLELDLQRTGPSLEAAALAKRAMGLSAPSSQSTREALAKIRDQVGEFTVTLGQLAGALEQQPTDALVQQTRSEVEAGVAVLRDGMTGLTRQMDDLVWAARFVESLLGAEQIDAARGLLRGWYELALGRLDDLQERQAEIQAAREQRDAKRKAEWDRRQAAGENPYGDVIL